MVSFGIETVPAETTSTYFFDRKIEAMDCNIESPCLKKSKSHEKSYITTTPTQETKKYESWKDIRKRLWLVFGQHQQR